MSPPTHHPIILNPSFKSKTKQETKGTKKIGMAITSNNSRSKLEICPKKLIFAIYMGKCIFTKGLVCSQRNLQFVEKFFYVYLKFA